MLTKQIFHNKNLNLNGSCIKREAVRAVIIRDDKYLLIYSPVNGDYKFPGGGMEPGESIEDALRREVLEECGFEINEIKSQNGLISEFSEAREDHIDYFQMDSHYYFCTVYSDRQYNQKLDDYERDLGFKPVWITLEEALKTNRKILQDNPLPPKWTKRETLFLEYLNNF